MSKSKIILTLLAGVVIGTAITYTINQNRAANIDEEAENPTNSLDSIAKQFADKISNELKAAERKIKTVVKNEIDGLTSEREMGLFL